jgi:hypothetical protein
MKTQRMIRRTTLAMALAAFGVSGTARAVPEAESNHPIQSAQSLDVGGGSITVNGAIRHFGTSQPDVDFYSFDAKEGDVITVDIGGVPKDTLDATLTLFGPGPTFPRLIWNSEASLDSNSESDADPRIDAFRLSATGRYTVAVSSFPVMFNSGGTMTRTNTLSSGVYTLIISGITPAMQYISIDIKPGNNDEPAPINPKSKGVIPVALLSNADFDPFAIDVASLRFGRTGDEASLSRCSKDGRDLNADGKPDRVCHFDNEKAGFTKTDTSAMVKGTVGGKPFQGNGDLKVVPQK